MKQPASRRADLLVDQRAQLLVGEVVRRLRSAHLAYQAARHQALQGLDRFLVASPARRANGVEVEGAADHSRGLQQLASSAVELAQTGL